MHLTFSPMRRDDALTLEVQGETLIVNGQALELSAVPEGGMLLPDVAGCAWLAAPVRRVSGVLHVSLILPHGARAPQETLFPMAIEVTADGPVSLPLHDLPDPPEA